MPAIISNGTSSASGQKFISAPKAFCQLQPSRSEHQTIISDAGPSDSFAYGLGTMSYSLPSSASISHSSSHATR